MSKDFKNVVFLKNTNIEFNRVLSERVKAYFDEKNISRFANTTMVVKTIFMLCLYVIPFILLFVSTSILLTILLWCIMGVGMAGIGLSIMHDANHGAYSSNPNVNKWVGRVLNLVGGNPANWQIQHNVLHHTYTNVDGLDEDIAPPVGMLRFSPNTKWRKIHKYQYLFAWFFYGMMTLMWFVSKDFKQAIRYNKKGLSSTQGLTLGTHMRKIIIGKIVYAALFIVLPIIFSPIPWYFTIIGFLIMQFIAGFILACVFQPAHVVPTSNYKQPDDSGNLNDDWKVHQLYNTANFATKSRLFSWYVGGLNFQVEHHLFPNICHVHYKALSKIVEKTTSEFNLPYFSNRTFIGALKDHTIMLKMLGKKDCPLNVHLG